MDKMSCSAVGLASLIGLALLVGCKKDEEPPPLPTATAAPQPAEPVVLMAEEEPVDAGVDAGAAPKTGGRAKPKASFQNCCNALQQNAANAPEPTATYMKQAAATCNALVSQGQDQNAISAAIRGALGGAALPGACL